MEQKDLDIIRDFEKLKERTMLQRIGLWFFIALSCCSFFILIDVIEKGAVEVTMPYFMEKFFLGSVVSFIGCFSSYYNTRKKYKKLKEKEENQKN